MKTIQQFSLLVLLAILLGSCTKQPALTTAEILDNDEQRKEIMTAICDDHERMTEMIAYMTKSEHAMVMLREDQDMMRHMVGNNDMMLGTLKDDKAMAELMLKKIVSIMEEDAAMCNTMGGVFMKNEHMRNLMDRMSELKGSINDEGTETCIMHGKLISEGVSEEKEEQINEFKDKQNVL